MAGKQETPSEGNALRCTNRLDEWHFQTRLGSLRIAPSQSRDGRWELWLGDEPLGSYHRPDAAAADVADAVTGHPELDELLDRWAPDDLTEWTHYEPR